MWVIKIDATLIGSPELGKWLDIVERNGDGKVVIVPSGGFLSDTVYDAQRATHVSDEVAHRMAMLSMDQSGLLMVGLNSKLVVARTELELAERGWQHRGIVWLPSHMVNADVEIPKNKLMGSDSLAAWLAHKLEAQHLVIVKCANTLRKQASVADLTRSEWVDSYFKQYMQAKANGGGFNSWILNKQFYHLFDTSFNADSLAQHALAITP